MIRIPKKIFLRCLLFFIALFQISCIYKFSNLHSKNPSNVKSIYIESIYNTAHKVLPHELLWGQIQQAFARNGRLKVTTVDQADSYLRTRLIDAKTTNADPVDLEPALDEPELNNLKQPPAPSSFKQLTRSASLSQNETLSFLIEVELWNLKTKKMIFKKRYSASSPRYRILDSLTTPETQFLRSEEALEIQFENLSRKISKHIVSDVFNKF